MNRRDFLKKASIATSGIISAPYILPTGRLFAPTGQRLVNHVVFVLFAGGVRNQEAVDQQFLANQGLTTEGNIMNNMLAGAAPTNYTSLYNPLNPVLSQPLQNSGTLFKEVIYSQGPTGHYNGHTVALTGNYTETGLNLAINPEFPTIFEYYRKHNGLDQTALDAWWISESLGPYPSLNYSRHPNYGAGFGANYLHPQTVFGEEGVRQLSSITDYHPEEVARINRVKQLLDNNFNNSGEAIPGIQNTGDNREWIKEFLTNTLNGFENQSLDIAVPGNNYFGLNGDLATISTAWQVLDQFAPELTVVSTFNVDACHNNFSYYLNALHRADYGVGWLWDKIQSHPTMANDTILIAMPEHGRNLESNTLTDANGLRAYDHTGDDNSRRCFTLIAGPQGVVNQGQVLGSIGNPAAETIDIVPTIAYALGFDNQISGSLMQGRVLEEAFV